MAVEPWSCKTSLVKLQSSKPLCRDQFYSSTLPNDCLFLLLLLKTDGIGRSIILLVILCCTISYLMCFISLLCSTNVLWLMSQKWKCHKIMRKLSWNMEICPSSCSIWKAVGLPFLLGSSELVCHWAGFSDGQTVWGSYTQGLWCSTVIIPPKSFEIKYGNEYLYPPTWYWIIHHNISVAFASWGAGGVQQFGAKLKGNISFEYYWCSWL